VERLHRYRCGALLPHLNPISQSQKFDPEGRFIRHWLPELAGLNKRDIHDPASLGGLFAPAGYPRPIVDLSRSRERALAAFRNLGQEVPA